jgi:predicted DNA helicase
LNCSGTGKTTTVVEIIRQLLKQDLRLLVCTPSNVAVDNILERMPARDDMVRVGPSGKIMSSNMDYSLDRLSARSDAGMLVQSMRQELDRLIQIQLPTSKSRQERKEIYQQMKELRKDIKAREPNIVKSIIKNARIIMTTLASACSKVLEDEKFDVLIIDEACQSTEPECWMAIWKARKVILVGDPHQLPPTILCNDAAKQGLQNTLFSRLLNVYGKKIEKILTVQYRMHPEIMNWCNKLVYNNALFGIPKDDWLLCNMANVEKNDETLAPLVFVDTAGCDYWESLEQEDAKTPKSEQLDRGVSKWNEEEAKVCFNYVKQLVSFGINKCQIAIISPYAAQVRHLKQLLGDDLKEVEVGTVDGFQGREKEVVLVSMVRSNPEGEVGFLADQRRLNVALTRSKRPLWVIADSETLSHDKFMKKMVDYWMEHAEIRYPYMYD